MKIKCYCPANTETCNGDQPIEWKKLWDDDWHAREVPDTWTWVKQESRVP